MKEKEFLQDLWGKRVKKHQFQMMRYLRWVFNDHFVIVLTFLLGIFAYTYANFLKTLPTDTWWARPIILIVFVLALFVGKLATLTKEADIVFLLPKEKQMYGYLKKSINYSFLLPAFWLVMITGFSLPLLVATKNASFSDFIFLWGMMLVLKFADLLLQMALLYKNVSDQSNLWKSLNIFVQIISVILSLWLYSWAGIILAGIWLVVVYQCLKSVQHSTLLWEQMVGQEEKRLYRIYQFINLFTDVPNIQPKAKRRRYLDFILKRIPKKHTATFDYLYTISFLRGAEYSGLFFRLTILGMICLFFVQPFWLSIGLSLLFIYLIGFQILPLYYKFDYLLFVQIYPVSKDARLKAIEKLLMIILIVVSILFGLVCAFVYQQISIIILIFVVNLIFSFLFVRFYVPKRLHKI